jgi:hypothetical protein
MPGNRNRSRVGLPEPGQHHHRRAFPGAVRADEPEDFARIDPEAQIVNGDSRAIRLSQIGSFEQPHRAISQSGLDVLD